MNPMDLWLASSAWKPMPFPMVLGADGAGVVEKLGDRTSVLRTRRSVRQVVDLSVRLGEHLRAGSRQRPRPRRPKPDFGHFLHLQHPGAPGRSYPQIHHTPSEDDPVRANVGLPEDTPSGARRSDAYTEDEHSLRTLSYQL